MKIAIASENGKVSTHFGRSKSFSIFEIVNNQITSVEVIPNPGRQNCFLPEFIKSLNIDVVISGGMGRGAKENLNKRNIQVIIGAKGETSDVVEDYLEGNLKSTEPSHERGGGDHCRCQGHHHVTHEKEEHCGCHHHEEDHRCGCMKNHQHDCHH